MSTTDSSVVRRLRACRAEHNGIDIIADPIALRLAVAWRHVVPRGKAFGARQIGRIMLGDRFFSSSTNKGFRFVGCRQSIDMIAFQKYTGAWNDIVYAECLGLLQPGSVFYDVGANAGYFTLGAGALKHAGLRVVAFEPLPMLARALAAAARVNQFDDIQVFCAALSDRVGSHTLHLPAHSIHASLVSRDPNRSQTVKVTTFRLDGLVASGALPPPDVIKMDVEGAEALVIDGAEDTLASYHPRLIVEIDENSRRFGHTPARILSRLRGLGYRSFTKLGKDGAGIIGQEQFANVGYGDFLVTA